MTLTPEDGLEVVSGYAYNCPTREGFEFIDLPASKIAICGIELHRRNGPGSAREGRGWPLPSS